MHYVTDDFYGKVRIPRFFGFDNSVVGPVVGASSSEDLAQSEYEEVPTYINKWLKENKIQADTYHLATLAIIYFTDDKTAEKDRTFFLLHFG